MNDLSLAQKIAVWALPVLFAITVHEVAHGWMALRRGDHTAQILGRLTLNPIKHIDPIGTVLVPLLLLYLGGFVFGWAKPVPVNFRNLNDPKRDMVWVAAAGPLANLGMAILWAFVARIGVALGPGENWFVTGLAYMGIAGILINVALMVLNLLPLPPLDGGRVLSGLLPNHLSTPLDRIEPYGFFILIALIATGVLGAIIGPPISLIQGLIFPLTGLGTG